MRIPKINRCSLSDCNIYQLLLQNNYTKKVYLFRVRDLEPYNWIRFCIPMELDECMPEGTYTYYLIPDDPYYFYLEEINVDIIDHTVRRTDKTPIVIDGNYLVDADNRLIVLNRFKVRIQSNGQSIYDGEADILVTDDTSEDKRQCGEIEKHIDIIQRGLLSYSKGDPFLQNEATVFENKITYKTFK